jgi:hypothetical protein
VLVDPDGNGFCVLRGPSGDRGEHRHASSDDSLMRRVTVLLASSPALAAGGFGTGVDVTGPLQVMVCPGARVEIDALYAALRASGRASPHRVVSVAKAETQYQQRLRDHRAAVALLLDRCPGGTLRDRGGARERSAGPWPEREH